jgi:predicted anti-sigma-YlaC factor YlaD
VKRCKDMLGALSGYIDGELEEKLCAEIDEHMKDCPDCRIVVDTLRKTVFLYRTHGHAELPEDVLSRVHLALDIEAVRARSEID